MVGRAEITLSINVKPTEPIIWDMTPEFVSKKLSAGNATLKSANGRLKMTTKNPANDDGFQIVITLTGADQFYLQDYPQKKLYVIFVR